MYVKVGNIYYKVYERKNGSRFYNKDRKRVSISQNRQVVPVKPSQECPNGKERLPSGRCVKKCVPPKIRNPATNRCKSPSRPSRRAPVRRYVPVQRYVQVRSSAPVGSSSLVRRSSPSRRSAPSRRSSPSSQVRSVHRSPVRQAKFIKLARAGHYIIPSGQTKNVIAKMTRYIKDNKLKNGDVLFIGHENLSYLPRGFYFVDHSKPDKVVNYDGTDFGLSFYSVNSTDSSYYMTMEKYKKIIGIPNVEYDDVMEMITNFIDYELDPDEYHDHESLSDDSD